jgi:hypothetical protein
LHKTDGARLIVENAILAAIRRGAVLENQAPPPQQTAQVEAMRESLVALLSLTSKTEGLSVEVRTALISAGKLVDGLFAACPATPAAG